MSVDARLVKRLPAIAGTAPFELDVHLRASPGITVLFGPSGSGKTLLLNCLGGFVRPDEGRILVNDRLYFDASTGVHVPPRNRGCGYIFQDHALFPHMTVRGNLQFAASSRSSQNGSLNRRRRINELLQTFELTDLAARKPMQLSGGQKQRAALARILVNEPALLLLDEPTRGLDARLRGSFYELLRRTREQVKVPIVLVTHDLEECFELADGVCIMEHGRFVQSGPRDTVFSKPASAEIARSLGIYTILPAEINALDPGRDTSRLEVFGFEVEGSYLPGHLIGDHGYLCVRSSEIRVLPAGGRPARNQLDAILIRQTASARGILLEFENEITAVVSESEYEDLRGRERLRLEVPPSAVHFIGK
jgi:molybdate transport system ATP-binding protein